jgi:hypothetical protein
MVFCNRSCPRCFFFKFYDLIKGLGYDDDNDDNDVNSTFSTQFRKSNPLGLPFTLADTTGLLRNNGLLATLEATLVAELVSFDPVPGRRFFFFLPTRASAGRSVSTVFESDAASAESRSISSSASDIMVPSVAS